MSTRYEANRGVSAHVPPSPHHLAPARASGLSFRASRACLPRRATLRTPRRRLDPMSTQHRPNRAGRNRDTEPDQLSLDAPLAPGRVLPCKPHHELGERPLAVRGRLTKRCEYVQRSATSSRCQRSSVAGETKNDDHAGFGSERLSAASSSRSAGRSRGLWAARCDDQVSASRARARPLRRRCPPRARLGAPRCGPPRRGSARVPRLRRSHGGDRRRTGAARDRGAATGPGGGLRSTSRVYPPTSLGRAVSLPLLVGPQHDLDVIGQGRLKLAEAAACLARLHLRVVSQRAGEDDE